MEQETVRTLLRVMRNSTRQLAPVFLHSLDEKVGWPPGPETQTMCVKVLAPTSPDKRVYSNGRRFLRDSDGGTILMEGRSSRRDDPHGGYSPWRKVDHDNTKGQWRQQHEVLRLVAD